MSKPIDQAALRKAAQSAPPTYPDWLDVGKLVYISHLNCHGQILGFLDRIVNVEISGISYQVELESLAAPNIEITNTIDLSTINHPTYQQIASDWLVDLSGIKIIPGNGAITSGLPDNLHNSLKKALIATGIKQFYSHQLAAWSELTTGKSITLTTPTASGKTLAFTSYAFEIALSHKKTTLTGLPEEEISLIEHSGALTHEKTLLVLKSQSAPNLVTATMIRSLLGYGLSGLVFVNSRATAKGLFSQLRYLIGGYCSEIELFYGSLTAAKRTEIIDKLSRGKVKIIITTSALEAGLDLPSLDFVIIRGATSLNSLWERAGRAGRSTPGLIVFVPDGSNHIDYYYSNQPKRLFAPVEKIKLQPNYPPVLANHILCAATEGGIPSQRVSNFFGETSTAISAELLKQKQLFWGQNELLFKKGYPHKNVSLRGMVNETVNLIDSDTGEVFEEMALNFAHRECHSDALYVTSVEGETVIRRCIELDVEFYKAILQKVDLPNNRTQPIVEFEILTTTQLDSPEIIATAIDKGNIRASLWWGTIAELVLLNFPHTNLLQAVKSLIYQRI